MFKPRKGTSLASAPPHTRYFTHKTDNLFFQPKDLRFVPLLGAAQPLLSVGMTLFLLYIHIIASFIPVAVLDGFVLIEYKLTHMNKGDCIACAQ